MKKLNRLSLFTLTALLLLACEREAFVDSPLPVEAFELKKDFGRDGNQVVLPFKSKFTTEGDIDLENRSCEPLLFNFQSGGGQATHLGKFTTDMNFCIRPFPDANPEVEGELFAEYSNYEGSFVAANGDKIELSLVGTGRILTTGTPGVLVFRDQFLITGGTGRFEGASGSLTTESFNFGATTEHEWTGTISLAR